MDFRPFFQIVQNPKIPHIFEAELLEMDVLKKYEQVEVHYVVFPFSRKISADDLDVQPFQEYVKDIQAQQKSVYAPMQDSKGKRFGLILVFLLLLFVAFWHPEMLTTSDTFVGAIGAYIAGKELWADLANLLVKVTTPLSVKYQTSYFSYQLERFSTLTQYFNLANAHRYEKQAVWPSFFDYIETSNSKTVRLRFVPGDLGGTGTNAHVFSVQVLPELLDEFLGKSSLQGLKVSLSNRRFFIWKNREYFQSILNGKNGCLDGNQVWQPGAVFHRTTWRIGNWKYFQKNRTISNQILFHHIKNA